MIRQYTQEDKQAWDSYVLGHRQGLAYHLTAWKEAVERAYGFNGRYLIAENGKRIKGILPLIHIKPPLLSGSLVSLPYCDAGGPLADSPEIEKQLLLKALETAAKQKIKTLTIRSIRPFAQIDPEITQNPNKARMLLSLPKDSKTLLASLKAKVRSQVKKPARDGLTVEHGGMELLDEFYPLFAENMRDLGSPVHSENWIRQILFSYKNQSHLFLVRMHDGAPAAGGILLCHPDRVSVPWASSLRRFNRWNPNMMLYWTFLQYAADHLYPVFDFGRSTPGEGTYSFKKQWGARPSSLHWADFTATAPTHTGTGQHPAPLESSYGSAASQKRKLAESIIMKMPMPVFKTFGAITRKYISL